MVQKRWSRKGAFVLLLFCIFLSCTFPIADLTHIAAAQGKRYSTSLRDQLKQARALYQEAKELQEHHRYAEAISVFEELRVLLTEALGAEHLQVAGVLNELGVLYQAVGEFTKAEPLYHKALSIYEKHLGGNDLQVATLLNNLGLLYQSMQAYTKAEPFFQRALSIRKKILGVNHPDVLTTLDSLLDILSQQIRAFGQQKRYHDVIRVTGKILDSIQNFPGLTQGPLAEKLDKCLTTLDKEATTLHKQGRYQDSIRLVEKGLAIKKAVFGPAHINVAESLYLLATNHNLLGNYTQAEPLFHQALRIMENALGDEVFKVAAVLNNLAMLYYQLGQHDKVEPLLKRTLAIQEKHMGQKHPDVARTLNNLGVLYHTRGEFAKAEPFYQQALEIREQMLFWAGQPALAESLNNLAGLYQSRGEYIKAEPLFQRALAIEEKVLGQHHPKLAQTLRNAAALYTTLGDYAKAEVLNQRAIEILEKTLGKEHLEVAKGLNNFAMLYYIQGEYRKAEPLLKRALAIHTKVLGPEHPTVALSIANLARLYHSRGEYTTAKALYQEALAIQKKTRLSDRPELVAGLTNIAEFHYFFGEYDKAESYYNQALEIAKRILGPAHPDVAKILSHLAVFYCSMDDYARAESLLKQSLTIYENTFDRQHPDAAQDLNNLADLYRTIGDYTKAEHYFTQALAILENSFGPAHPAVAPTLNNLGVLYDTIEEPDKAEEYYQRAITIAEKTFGSADPHVATSLNNLALLYHRHGELGKAEPLYQRALTIQEQTYGTEHPSLGLTLNNLGALYESLGQDAHAEAFYQRALKMRENALGPDHAAVAQTLSNLAGLHAARNNFTQAYTCYKQVQQIDEKLIENVMSFTSEKQKLAYLMTQKTDLDVLLSLVVQHFEHNGSVIKETLDTWLKRKGLTLEAQKRFQEALFYSDNPEILSIFRELSRVRTQISRLVFTDTPDVYRQKMTQLEEQKAELEAQLSRLSQAYAVQQKVGKADAVTVAKALPANTVLVEFAKVEMVNFKAKSSDNAHYLAFVLHAGNGDKVELTDLGEADNIDRAVAALKKQITTGRTDDRHFKMLTTSSEQVYQLVFEPLKEQLGEVKEIFISPDGNLNLLPFEVLTGPDGRFLIEDYTFNYLAAGRDILGFGAMRAQAKTPLLMGDPDFDFVPGINAEAETGSRQKPAIEGASASLSFEPGGLAPGDESRSVDMRGFHFKRLPWTKKEVETIHALLGQDQVGLYTGKDALEDVLLQSEAPRILHLATHGFFLKDQNWQAAAQDAFSRGAVISLQPPASQTPSWTLSAPLPSEQFENPLLRSGIALAGANTATGEEGHASGIVTAEKILGLKLRGTEMVVLSACETGLGSVQAGEGVFGLRRAFTQAGADSLVMSLWAVPDQETQELMVQFYQNLLSGKMSRSQALRQAVLHQVQIVQERYGSPHPLYWGAFVFLGEP